MKMLRFGLSLLLFCALITVSAVSAQKTGLSVPGQVLLDLKEGTKPGEIRQEPGIDKGAVWTAERQVSRALNIWLWTGPAGSEYDFISSVHHLPQVENAQLNHWVAERCAPDSAPPFYPNDSLFAQQWSLRNIGQNGGLIDADVDAPEGWDYSTGGISPAGDSVVIAIIDSGFDVFHPDWGQNLWVNHDEIPDDGQDNDGNGFIDDYAGWNVFNQTDHVEGMTTSHGTSVAGIIGAAGNNSVGISGVNWRSKLQLIVGGVNEAYIIEAYDYVLQSRRQYNTSHGNEGAFVVAVNCSFGTDFGQPSQSPLWCAMLDTLGYAGILTVSATANGPWNVDEYGDLPTTCPSPFQISVTSLNRWNEKHSTSAWGPVSVDLGAYGHEVFVLKPGNSYGTLTGTSFAAPHVSGAIGLLYATHCPNLISLAQSSPAEAALWVKQLLLEHVTPVESIDSITLTGGRLNIGASTAVYQTGCQICPAPYSVRADSISANSAYLHWLETSIFLDVFLRWRIIGDSFWNYIDHVNPDFQLTGLNPCTEYEFALKALCPDDNQSQWTAPVAFRTDGCCRPPEEVWADGASETSLSIHWEAITAAVQYHLRYRIVGAPIWNVVATTQNNYDLGGLSPCSAYEFAVQTHCENGFSTAFSETQLAQTKGCGSCTEVQYCPSGAVLAIDEWIEQVELDNGWSHHSVGGIGYQDFTANPEVNIPDISEGLFMQMYLTPGYSSLHYPEYFKAFIDFGMDGSFDQPEDLVLDSGMPCVGPMSQPLTLPVYFPFYGMTRMRVVMKYAGGFYTPPLACEQFDYGQVEDYCVILSPKIITPVNEQNSIHRTMAVYPSPTGSFAWLSLPDGQTFDVSQALVFDITGRLVAQIDLDLSANSTKIDAGSWKTGAYIIRAGRWSGRLVVE